MLERPVEVEYLKDLIKEKMSFSEFKKVEVVIDSIESKTALTIAHLLKQLEEVKLKDTNKDKQEKESKAKLDNKKIKEVIKKGHLAAKAEPDNLDGLIHVQLRKHKIQVKLLENFFLCIIVISIIFLVVYIKSIM